MKKRSLHQLQAYLLVGQPIGILAYEGFDRLLNPAYLPRYFDLCHDYLGLCRRVNAPSDLPDLSLFLCPVNDGPYLFVCQACLFHQPGCRDPLLALPDQVEDLTGLARPFRGLPSGCRDRLLRRPAS